MEVGLHSPFTAINLPSSIPVCRFNFPRKHPFLPLVTSCTNNFTISSSETIIASSITTSTAISSSFTASTSGKNFNWMVIMDKPPEIAIHSKPQLINYYVTTLQKAMNSDEKDAQRCIYDASCDKTHFGFCCFVDEQTSHVLARMSGVLSVRPDTDMNSITKDYSYNFNLEDSSVSLPTTLLFPEGSKKWLVCVEKPSARVFSKAQMVDYYVDILTKVLVNEKDAQMCLYHTSWQSNYGFCCILDDGCAQELATVPGVLSVQPDENFQLENKYHQGGRLSSDAQSFAGIDTSKTKLFITGLSFYTSEKTLRAAFGSFGELTEVKVIMDKISKRSKGYAFVEYTTEDAATTALQEMNGKIINGWMIVVDRATNKPRLSK